MEKCETVGTLFWPTVLPELSLFDLRKLANAVQALCCQWSLRLIFPFNGNILRTYYVSDPIIDNRKLYNKNNIWGSWMWYLRNMYGRMR